MEASYLYKIINSIDILSLPFQWRETDFENYSESKKLYPYQREALEHTIKILYKFYENYPINDINRLKQKFSIIASNNGLTGELSKKFFANKITENRISDILLEYYHKEPYDKEIPAFNFINRMCFWMATGSGKSIVLIKLIELLHNLMKNELIPQQDILFLTHRPDLIEQLLTHIEEFNQYSSSHYNISIIARDLRDFPEFKRENALFNLDYINIFYYRSDLISDTQKENIIDFRNYDNFGNWYLILDEAHKGDNEESKRKQFYNILCRNGFLFNFSATFTDEIDILSTAYNLNLSEYIKKGFGKHIFVLKEQFENFQSYEQQSGKKIISDYVETEKQKIVLMSLILLCFIKKKRELLVTSELYYHNPLMLTLVNSVSAEDSDLFLFFRELEKIASNELSEEIFQNAKETLIAEFESNKKVEFEDEIILSQSDLNEIREIKISDVLYYVFNTQTSGKFEIKRNPKNIQELSFRVKSSAESKIFALIKIGDIKEFEKNNLSSYDIEEDFNDTSIFENIDNSSVNILMGSRAFYEGWDSTRPNIINFINIGTQREAKKFILQSVGRGIRIEPIKNNRRRLLPITNMTDKLAEKYKGKLELVKPIETLFIFGTNKNAIVSVLEYLKSEQTEEEIILDIFEKLEINSELYIPKYKTAKDSTMTENSRLRLKINKEDFLIFKDLMTTIDKRILSYNYNLSISDINLLEEKLQQNKFTLIEEEKLGGPSIILKKILNYYKIAPEAIETFSALRDEISHYKHIKVNISTTGSSTAIEFHRLQDLKNKIEKSKNPIDLSEEKEKLKELYKNDLDRLLKEYDKLKNISTEIGEEIFQHRSDKIKIKKLLNHYYFPTIIPESGKIDWIKHIIDTESEQRFIQALEKYITRDDNFFNQFDWWIFSKIDHTIDKEIRVPYIDPNIGKRDFLPDFVFWFQKDKDYHILYIDPKGTGRNEYHYKVDGYRDLFTENDMLKQFNFNNLNISVHLRLVANDKSLLSESDFYKKYWLDVNNFKIEI